ncbi:MAG TPA: LuxR C-terminal-related transcriptional regulator, partial [Gemmataceae bacterium]|nr:LuxR C-terminal-related transcriptional regulator [Gemmataceae bacterium]
DLKSWDGLWSLLMLITVRKCAKRAHHFQADRRDVRREVAAERSEGVAAEGMARDASPFEMAALTEVVEQLFRGLKDRECQMLQAILEGHSAAEIGLRAGVSERSVYRLLERIKKRLERLNAEDAGT